MFPHLARFHFRTWRVFTSALGAFSLPHLARFHFHTWRVFTSTLGAFSLPHLARFHFRTWHIITSSLVLSQPRSPWNGGLQPPHSRQKLTPIQKISPIHRRSQPFKNLNPKFIIKNFAVSQKVYNFALADRLAEAPVRGLCGRVSVAAYLVYVHNYIL